MLPILPGVFKIVPAAKIFKKHVCNLCIKSFSTSHKLKHHSIAIHNCEKKMYKCSKCEKSYATLAVLNSHFRDKHSTEKKYKCKNCFKLFTRPNHLTKHVTSCKVKLVCNSNNIII